MDSGVVWSGKLNTDDTTVDNLIGDDYATVGELTVECMGMTADLWVQDCPSIDINGDVFGEIHMPDLKLGERIRIGGRFGEINQAAYICDLEGYLYAAWPVTPTEGSPRGYWADIEDNNASFVNGVAAYSRIRIQQTAAMHGQIILNAHDQADPVGNGFWKGDVLVGSGDPDASPADPPAKVYSTDTNRDSVDRLGPYYLQESLADGGGAIGLVIYNLHPRDCDPDDGSVVCELTTEDWDETSGTDERETLVVSHYGLVEDEATGGDIPFKIERQSMLCVMPNCPPSWNEISSACTVRTGQGANGREVWICMTPTGSPPTAVTFGDLYNYKATPRETSNVTDLRSQDTFVTTSPEVFMYQYNFTLSSLECFELYSVGAEMAEADEPEIFYTLDDLSRLLLVDFNRDGTLDVEDVEELLERIESGE